MNPYIIIGALVGVILSFVFGGIVGYEFRAAKVPTELAEQQTTDDKQCNKAQQVTKEANDELTKDRDAVSAKLDALRLQHPSTCVRITRPIIVAKDGSKHADGDGESPSLNSDWLRVYAAQCETYRNQVEACSDFVAKERELTQPQ